MGPTFDYISQVSAGQRINQRWLSQPEQMRLADAQPVWERLLHGCLAEG